MHNLIDDLIGMNATPIRDMPVVADEVDAQRLTTSLPGIPLSIAGLRHTQGGHTAIDAGRMLLTMPSLNRIGRPRAVAGMPWVALIEVEAGASWEELHRRLRPYGMATMVQQSSAAFSIGGSISVNCHGRDPRWGPIVDSVESVVVLTGTGKRLIASRDENRDLFDATVGGYGACGLILSATLRVLENVMLEYRGDVGDRDVHDCADHLHKLLGEAAVHMHYTWLCCVPGALYKKALIADLVHLPMPTAVVDQELLEQDWGDSELLRAGWAAARVDVEIRRQLWKQLEHRHRQGDDTGGKGQVLSRTNWNRVPVDFTAYRGSETSTSLLQEYFVPPAALPDMVTALKSLFQDPANKIVPLSTTIRYVRADDETALSYSPGGPRACIAIDAEASVAGGTKPSQRTLATEPREAIRSAIEHALQLGGSYYLPYLTVADRPLFERAYKGHQRLQDAIDRYNPRSGGVHRFWNRFLTAYFD